MKPLCRSVAAFGLLILVAPGYAGAAERYKAIDRHALKAPRKAEESLDKLAQYLVGPCRNDREKVRAIYRWITDRIAYDVEGLQAGKRRFLKPESVLRERRTICAGYANLFVDLCGRAGVKAVKVLGYSKGAGYKPGQKFTQVDHSWNAVKIGRKWYLLDATWGAGRIDGKKFVKQFSEFYFLTPPQTFIFSHFPEKAKWQLLKERRTLAQFEKGPSIGRRLFEMGITPARIRALLSQKTFRGIVQAWRTPGFSVTVIAVPLSKHLQAGREYRFAVRSRECTEMIVENNGTRIALEREGDVFRGSVTVQEGPLDVRGTIAGTAGVENKRYSSVLGYMVN